MPLNSIPNQRESPENNNIFTVTNKEYPIYYLLEKDKRDTLLLYIKEIGNSNIDHIYKETLLNKAIEKGDPELTSIFLKIAGDHKLKYLQKELPNGSTALHSINDISVLKQIFESVDEKDKWSLLITPNSSGSTILHKAVRGENKEMVPFLLEQAGDRKLDYMKIQNSSGDTALHNISENTELSVIFMNMVGKNAIELLEITNKKGNTVLHDVINDVDEHSLQLYLKIAGDKKLEYLQRQNNFGCTPLLSALYAQFRSPSLIKTITHSVSTKDILTLLAIAPADSYLPIESYLREGIVVIDGAELDDDSEVRDCSRSSISELRNIFNLEKDDSLANIFIADALYNIGRKKEAEQLITAITDYPFVPESWKKVLDHELTAKRKPTIAWLCDAAILSLSQNKAFPSENIAKSYNTIISNTEDIVPPRIRRNAILATQEFINTREGFERYEKIYKELSSQFGTQRLNRLGPHIVQLLLTYNDETALTLSRSLLNEINASTLKSGAFRGTLIDLINQIINLPTQNPEKEQLLHELFRLTTNTGDLSKQLAAIKGLIILNMEAPLIKQVKDISAQRAVMTAKLNELNKLMEQRRTHQSAISKETKETQLDTARQLKDLSAQVRKETDQQSKQKLQNQHRDLKTELEKLKSVNESTEDIENKNEIEQLQKSLNTLQIDTVSILKETLSIKSNGLITAAQLDSIKSYFSNSHNPDAPMLYLAGLLKLRSDDSSKGDHALKDFALWADNLKNLNSIRYDISHNPLLKYLNRFAKDRVEQWCRLTSNQEVLKRLKEKDFTLIQGPEDKESNIVLLLKEAIIGGHLPKDKCSILNFYIHNPTGRPKLKELLNKNAIDPNSKIKLEDIAIDNKIVKAQRLLIDIFDGNISQKNSINILKEIADLLELPKSSPFLNDLNELKKLLLSISNSSKDAILTLSDKPVDLLLVGTDVGGSCQNVVNDPDLNRGLLGYMLNGQTIPLGHKNEDGQWITRALVRLAIAVDKNNKVHPVVLLERIYPKSATEVQRAELRGAAKMIADTLKMAAISAEEGNPKLPIVGTVYLQKGRAYAEYVDANDLQVVEGKMWPCKLNSCCFLQNR